MGATACCNWSGESFAACGCSCDSEGAGEEKFRREYAASPFPRACDGAAAINARATATNTMLVSDPRCVK